MRPVEAGSPCGLSVRWKGGNRDDRPSGSREKANELKMEDGAV